MKKLLFVLIALILAFVGYVEIEYRWHKNQQQT